MNFNQPCLKLCRQFYQVYPEIGQPVADTLRISQPVADQLDNNHIFNVIVPVNKAEQLPNHPATNPEVLLRHFSFRHFTELFKVKESLKRLFYEQQVIKGNWPVYSENDLETELLNKIQSFLLELGNGFCFEARQKRITIGNEHDRVDLVFYNRILKCHVLVDLKVRAFSHEDVGQMNYYLNYFKQNIKEQTDNEPVGIILCTAKDHEKVQYATAGLSNQMFVSKYMLTLPSEEELLALVKLKEIRK